MDERDELQLFQYLKDNSQPANEDTLDELINKKDKYDINPNTNYAILDHLIKSNGPKLEQFFYDYNQTLTFSQRKDIILRLQKTDIGKKIDNQIGLKKIESFKEKYFQSLNELQKALTSETEESYIKLKQLFKTRFYVDNTAIKIPLIYGTNELKYSGLINDLYQCLFYNQVKQKNESIIEENKENKENKHTDEKCFSQNKGKLFERYPNSIIKNKTELDNSKNNDIITKKDENDKLSIKPMEIDLTERVEKTFNEFSEIGQFIIEYLDIILDKEFNECFKIKKTVNLDDSPKFNHNYNITPEIDSLFFHLLFFDLLMIIFSVQGRKNYDVKSKYIFFEKKAKKIIKLRKLKKFCKIISLETMEEITFNNSGQIKNEYYKIIDLENNDNTYIFNPYDYIFQNFDNFNNFEDILRAFQDSKNFSLNKIFKERSLFNDNELSKLFNENIKLMLKSKLSDQLFNQFDNYKKYKNPFIQENGDKFINQTFDITYYMPFPFTNVAGYTYKNYGLIFLNSRKLIANTLKPNTFFFKKICYISFKKVVNIHEIIGHYCSCIVHGNDILLGLETPQDTFIDYGPTKEFEEIYSCLDGGDKGEAIIFGNKIKFIFIIGALFILNNDNYEENIDEFRKKFIKANEPNNFKETIFNAIEESKNSEIINCIKKSLQDVDDEIKITISNSLFSFRFYFNTDSEDEPIFEDGILFWDRLTHLDRTFKKRNFN